jgi:predicted signal transduction protein with EAL and GGDEF domain
MNKRLNNFVDVVVRIQPVLDALDQVRIKLDNQEWSDLLDVPGVEALVDAIMDLDREVQRNL